MAHSATGISRGHFGWRVVTPELLRFLDMAFGVPACWALTGVRWFVDRVMQARFREPDNVPKQVLLVQLAESGSMILADPAIRHLQTNGNYVPFVLTLDRNRDSLAITGTIPPERILVLRTHRLMAFIADILCLRKRVQGLRIEAVIDFELFTRFSALLCYWVGVRTRVGLHSEASEGLYRGDLFTHRIPFRSDQHMACNYLRLAAALGSPGGNSDPDRGHDTTLEYPKLQPRDITPHLRQSVEERLATLFSPGQKQAPLVLVNANASALLPQRRWPEGHFIELIYRILREHADARVLLIGSKEDWRTGTRIQSAVANARCVNGAGAFFLPELPALFACSNALISNDSGPAHFASVTDIPIIVLFGPETPVLFRPLGNVTVFQEKLPCSPCVRANNQRRTSCRDNQCMKRISVEQVFHALQAILYGSTPRQGQSADAAWLSDSATLPAETIAT